MRIYKTDTAPKIAGTTKLINQSENVLINIAVESSVTFVKMARFTPPRIPNSPNEILGIAVINRNEIDVSIKHSANGISTPNADNNK